MWRFSTDFSVYPELPDLHFDYGLRRRWKSIIREIFPDFNFIFSFARCVTIAEIPHAVFTENYFGVSEISRSKVEEMRVYLSGSASPELFRGRLNILGITAWGFATIHLLYSLADKLGVKIIFNRDTPILKKKTKYDYSIESAIADDGALIFIIYLKDDASNEQAREALGEILSLGGKLNSTFDRIVFNKVPKNLMGE